MKKENLSFAYFALTGNDFDPNILTHKLGVSPTEIWRKGEKAKYKSVIDYSCWKLVAENENLTIEELIDEIVSKLFDKIDIITELKAQCCLNSTLEIVMYIDTNENESTPAFGHSLKVIEFLFKTQTETDVDIYRFNSGK